MDIQKKLKQYKEKKARVETTMARIEAYQVLMCDPALGSYGYYTYMKELGMPRGTGGGSMVEDEIDQRELTKELIGEWIKEDRSRIAFIEIEVNQIDLALSGLTSWEEYVIRCKHFDNMFWANIEISFNAQFPQKHDITQDRIRQINKEALGKLEAILTPFYQRYSKVS